MVCFILLLAGRGKFSSAPIIILAGVFIYVILLITAFIFIDNNSVNSYNEVNEFYNLLHRSLIPTKYTAKESGNIALDPSDPNSKNTNLNPNVPNNSGSIDSNLINPVSQNSDTTETTDILELMSINMKEIKEYYVLSKNMAKSSFRLSVSMCLLGFTLIASSIISIYILDINLGSAVVPAVGGAIVEVIAGTTLIVYKQSLDQLNKYYEALHDNERFLSVVNITDKVSPDKKDDVYLEIIRSQLNQKDNFISQ